MSEWDVEQSVQIVNPLGLHARPASSLVRLAGTFGADVELEKDGLNVNGKSIMGVLMLAAEAGSILAVRSRGTDAVQAVRAIVDLVRRGFDDEASE